MFKRFCAIAVAALALFCGSQAVAPNNTQAHEVLVYGDDNTMHYLETETVRKAGGSYYAWIKIAIKNKSFENARFRFTPEVDDTVTVSIWTVLPPVVEDVDDTVAEAMAKAEKKKLEKAAKTPQVIYPDPLTMANVQPGDRQGWVEIGETSYSQAYENYWTTVQFYCEHPELAKPIAGTNKTTK